MRFLIMENPKILTAEQLKATVEANACSQGEDLSLEIKKPVVTRELASAVLVAMISATSACVGILITNLLKLAHQKAAQKIVIQGKNGQRLEVPANMPQDQFDNLIQKVRDLDQEEVRISMK